MSNAVKDTIKFKGASVHYDITTFCDVCETANGPRLLSFTSTLRGRDMDECVWVGIDSEYHHQVLVRFCKESTVKKS